MPVYTADYLTRVLEKTFEMFIKFEQRQISNDLRFVTAECGNFRVTAIADVQNLTFFIHNKNINADLGYLVVDKDTFDIVGRHTFISIVQTMERVLKNMKVLKDVGVIDTKYF